MSHYRQLWKKAITAIIQQKRHIWAKWHDVLTRIILQHRSDRAEWQEAIEATLHFIRNARRRIYDDDPHRNDIGYQYEAEPFSDDPDKYIEVEKIVYGRRYIVRNSHRISKQIDFCRLCGEYANKQLVGKLPPRLHCLHFFDENCRYLDGRYDYDDDSYLQYDDDHETHSHDDDEEDNDGQHLDDYIPYDPHWYVQNFHEDDDHDDDHETQYHDDDDDDMAAVDHHWYVQNYHVYDDDDHDDDQMDNTHLDIDVIFPWERDNTDDDYWDAIFLHNNNN